jgi:hypothetical protein
MKAGYTHIAVVLDSSGSMASIIEDTIGGFNTFLKAQKEAEGEATLSLVEFAKGHQFHNNWNAWEYRGDSKYNIRVDTKYSFMPIGAVQPLSTANYIPQGMTPLLDTIGDTLDKTGIALRAMPESERPSKVLFVIITDGEENASHVYNFQKINEMIQHQNIVYKWEFVFLGANQDAIREASKMGIHASTSMSYGTSKHELTATYGVLAAKTQAFRAVNATADALAFTDQERAQAKQEGDISG